MVRCGTDWPERAAHGFSVDKLFVYGIFLGAGMREHYGMVNPQYATVKDYATWGNHIVCAYPDPGKGLALTGLLVDIPKFINRDDGRGDQDNWMRLDALEGGYTREVIKTTDGTEAFMYVGRARYDRRKTNSDY